MTEYERDKSLVCNVRRGTYTTRSGDIAEVVFLQRDFAFGEIGYDPKDAIWTLNGRHRFKKYDLVCREKDRA